MYACFCDMLWCRSRTVISLPGNTIPKGLCFTDVTFLLSSFNGPIGDQLSKNVRDWYSQNFQDRYTYGWPALMAIPFLSLGKCTGPLYGLSAGVQSRLDPCPERTNCRTHGWPALVAEWSTHSTTMCSRAWCAQWPGLASAQAHPPTKELFIIIPMHMNDMINRELILVK